MFVVLLRFGGDKSRAGQLMEAHNAWIRRGLDDGVFLLVGTLQPALGGGLFAHNISRAELEQRVQEDPFVAEKLVTADILEITPSRTDERLQFLLN
jgi:uncharacterized protein YciI